MKEERDLQEIYRSRSQCLLPCILLVGSSGLVRKAVIVLHSSEKLQDLGKASIKPVSLLQCHSLTKLHSAQFNKNGKESAVVLQLWKQR